MKSLLFNTGLTLSGGGARGIFHLGVLQALEEHGYKPEVISGTSAGALAGALYAQGLSPKELMAFAQKFQLVKFMRWGLPGAGISDMTYLRKRLLEVFSAQTLIEELQIPVFITGTNINKGKTTIFSTGPLVDAICISCSVPLVFEPILYKGDLHLDGGVLMNLPTKPIRPLCKTLIGVNVHPIHLATEDEMAGFVGVAQRIVDFTIWSNTRRDARRCDLLIEPPKAINKYRMHSISKAEELYEMGYKTASLKLEHYFSVNPTPDL